MKTPEYVIRKFDSSKDTEELKKMLAKFNFLTSYDMPNKTVSEREFKIAENQIKEFHDSENAWCFVAVNKEDVPVGFISCHKYNNVADKHIILIFNIFIIVIIFSNVNPRNLSYNI